MPIVVNPVTKEDALLFADDGGQHTFQPPLMYADTTTNLGASATFTGTTRDMGTRTPYARFAATATAGVAGTLRIEMSVNGTNWFKAAEVAVAANAAQQLSVIATTRYHRVVFVNGASAQTGTLFAINSGYFRA